MSDKEMRGVVLKAFYDRRRDGYIQWVEFEGVPGMPDGEDLYRICEQLLQSGLIDGQPVRGGGGNVVGGVGKINVYGTNVIEGKERSSLPITFNFFQRNITVSGSQNVQIGDGNVQDVKLSVEKLVAAINNANASEVQKAEAKGLLKKLLEHPIFVAIVGALASKVGPSGSGDD